MKKCARCVTELPDTEFNKTASGKLRSYCKACSTHASVQWQRENRAVCVERQRKWKSENLERSREHSRTYYAKNKEYYRVATLSRIARKKSADGAHSLEELRALLVKQKYQCAACRTDISKSRHSDHIVPLSAGGSNYISNIQLLCPTCNLSKGRRSNVEFMQSRGMLL